MYGSYVLASNGNIITSGTEADCYNFAYSHLGEDGWGVLSYDEYNFYKNNPNAVKRSIVDNIARNFKSGRAKKFMQRPMANKRLRR